MEYRPVHQVQWGGWRFCAIYESDKGTLRRLPLDADAAPTAQSCRLRMLDKLIEGSTPAVASELLLDARAVRLRSLRLWLGLRLPTFPWAQRWLGLTRRGAQVGARWVATADPRPATLREVLIRDGVDPGELF